MNCLNFYLDGPRPINRTFLILLLIFATIALGQSSAAAPTESLAPRLLGEQLFLDKSLSDDGKSSCASCHRPSVAFSDGRKLAMGIHRQTGTRNTPSLLSLTETSFFWDGRASSLEGAVLHAFTNPSEMGLKSSTSLLRRVRRNPFYRVAFRQAYPFGQPVPQLSGIAEALATYVRSLSDGGNRYDAFISGKEAALSFDAQRGLGLFAGPAGCSRCHLLTGLPAPLTDSAFHRPEPAITDREANEAAVAKLWQLSPSPAAIAALTESDAAVSNLGRYVVTRNPSDIGAFRTPSLRNVALTAPYMHDGAVATLTEAVEREINTRTPSDGDRYVLSEGDRQDLVAFLEALTDLPPEGVAADPFESFWFGYEPQP